MESKNIKKIERFSDNLEELEKIDNVKSRVLKYIVYKKRTEAEIRNKFKNEFDDNIFEQVIDQLKELGYINDENYIDRAVSEFIALKSLSIKELKYKLLSKGVKSNDIEDYLSNNYDELKEYEINSARKLFSKKASSMDTQEVKMFLRKKGYTEESIKDAEYFYTGN